MDILEYLKKRQSELEHVKHPMSDYDNSFKYYYCFGIGVMALGNMKAITELQDLFENFLDIMDIQDESRNNIIVDINNYFDLKMSECIRIIKNKDEQYSFIVDLYKLYQKSLWSQEYCKKIINNYMEIFRFSHEEKKFFDDLAGAVSKKDLDMAIEVYNRFKAQGYEIDYGTVIYYYPDFYIEETYNDINVASGKTMILDKPAVINGSIIVERGGSLLIKGALIRMNGHIYVDGGRIQIKNARVIIEGCDSDFWLGMYKVAVVHIEDSFIDCGSFCGALYQNSGRLILLRTNIHRTDKVRAIDFRGRSAIIEDSEFMNCKEGAVDIYNSARMRISGTRFQDTYAEYGGAIRSETIGNVKFAMCEFKNCRAKYLGAAVYFKYQKYGQYVTECQCTECIPEDMPIFNVYEDDFELHI